MDEHTTQSLVATKARSVTFCGRRDLNFNFKIDFQFNCFMQWIKLSLKLFIQEKRTK